MRFCLTLGSTAILLWSQTFLWSQTAAADELADCNAQGSVDMRLECLQKGMVILRKQFEGRIVQTGSITFGHDQADSPDWTLQELAPGGAKSWTSAPILFSRPFAGKPNVYVAIAGISSSPNLDFDRFGFSLEPADVNNTGFKVGIRRTQGVLYRVTVNWLAYEEQRP